MGLFETFSADADLQKNGQWVEYGDCKVLIAFAGDGNPRYEKAIERHTRPYRRYLDNDKMIMSDSMKKQVNEAVVAAYAHAVVLDWDNVKEGDKLLEFSPKECKRVMLKIPAWFADVREYAGNISNYQAESDEADEKNL